MKWRALLVKVAASGFWAIPLAALVVTLALIGVSPESLAPFLDLLSQEWCGTLEHNV